MCGYAVEMVRSCYRSEWQLFADRPDIRTRGYYVFCPDDTPFAPIPTMFYSRNWTKGQWDLPIEGGECVDAKRRWHRGDPPRPFPVPILIGDKDELTRGKCPAPDWPGFVQVIAETPRATISLAPTLWKITIDPGDAFCGGVLPQEEIPEIGWVGVVFNRDQFARLKEVRIDATIAGNNTLRPFNTYDVLRLSYGPEQTFFGPQNVYDCGVIPFNRTILKEEFTANSFAVSLASTSQFANAGSSVTVEFVYDPPAPADTRTFSKGFDLRCYAGGVADLPDITILLTQLNFANIISAAYIDIDVARDLLEAFLGNGYTYTTVPVTTEIATGLIIARGPVGTVCVACGTSNFGQLAMQIASSLNPFEDINDMGCSGVHLAWALRIHTALVNAGVQPEEPIVFAGHSGGAAACCVLSAVYLSTAKGRDVTVLGFGTPRCGDERMANYLRPIRIRTIANVWDPVPSIPPVGDELGAMWGFITNPIAVFYEKFAKLPGQYLLDVDGTMIESQESMPIWAILEQFLLYVQGAGPVPPTDNHNINEYVARLERAT